MPYPISYKKVCEGCNQEVKDEDIVKAYEYAKNKFVVLDPEELENLRKENEDKAVEIIDFVKLTEIDPIYFERTYFYPRFDWRKGLCPITSNIGTIWKNRCGQNYYSFKGAISHCPCLSKRFSDGNDSLP